MVRGRYPSLSIIIPTKNRGECLESLVRSLLRQDSLPREVIIVDQSDSRESHERVLSLWRGATRAGLDSTCLRYIYDPTIPGAAMARNRGMEEARGEVWLFVDDDMEPESDFVRAVLEVYVAMPDVDGVSGIVTNYERPGLALRMWSGIFELGPFHDERQPIYWNAEKLRGGAPIPVAKFGSGLMSFRAEVVRQHRFDGTLRGVPPGEDVDFCARLGAETRLVIAPTARIAHRPSAVGRSREYWVREYVQGKLYAYHRNWAFGPWNRAAKLWFQVGCGLVAAFGSARRGSLLPWRGLLEGMREAARLTSGAPLK